MQKDKKDETPQLSTPTVTIPKIKTETDSSSNETSSYFYNSAGKLTNAGKLTKILYSNGRYNTVIYFANSITIRGYKQRQLLLIKNFK